jgi:tRNA (Thr-GGU) A37 N-methylase
VTVRETSGTRLRIGPIEAIDGTPVVDVKPVLADGADAQRDEAPVITGV